MVWESLRQRRLLPSSVGSFRPTHSGTFKQIVKRQAWRFIKISDIQLHFESLICIADVIFHRGHVLTSREIELSVTRLTAVVTTMSLKDGISLAAINAAGLSSPEPFVSLALSTNQKI